MFLSDIPVSSDGCQSGLSSDEHLPCRVSSCWGELLRIVRVGYVPFPQFNRTDNTLLRVCQVKALLSDWLQCCVLTQSVCVAGVGRSIPFKCLCILLTKDNESMPSAPTLVLCLLHPSLHSFYLVKPSSLTLIRASAEVGFLSRMAGIPERSLF